MNLDFRQVIISLVAGAFGFVYFSYGRRMQLPPLMLTGISLMAYPYFTSNLHQLILIGLGLIVLPFLMKWWR